MATRTSNSQSFIGLSARGFGGIRLLLLVPLMLAALAGTAQAQSPVLLGTGNAFAILAGSTITNTGETRIGGDVGLHPGTSITGFPPGQISGEFHRTDAVALEAKSDLVTAYNDAAGRPLTATLPPDAGGSTLTAGVYRTGSVPSLGLTGNLTLDGQGDPRAVFIFQVASSLITATDSSVTLINGAQACNVFWQVGSSATLGTRTAFTGNILAMQSISVNDSVVVDGRLLAREGAVTLINDTIARAQCAAGTGPPDETAPGDGDGDGGGDGPGGRPDNNGPAVRIFGIPHPLGPGGGEPGTPLGPGARCETRNFTARVRLRDRSGIRSVKVYLDGKLVRDARRTRFALSIRVRNLRIGRHTIAVVARDREGNRSVTRRRFARCALTLAAPRFTG